MLFKLTMLVMESGRVPKRPLQSEHETVDPKLLQTEHHGRGL